jgi:hypothetical protein
MYSVTLKFKTDQGRPWIIQKHFNDKTHCRNFVRGICKRKNYVLDEMLDSRTVKHGNNGLGNYTLLENNIPKNRE